MENQEGWKRDISKEDVSKVESALDSSIERLNDLNFWVAQDSLNTDRLRRNASFFEKRIQYLQQEKGTEELVQILSSAKKLLDDVINLDQIYRKNIQMSSEEKGIVSYTIKNGSDEEMLHNLDLKKQSINGELSLLEDLMQEKFPEEYLRIEQYIETSSNKTN